MRTEQRSLHESDETRYFYLIINLSKYQNCRDMPSQQCQNLFFKICKFLCFSIKSQSSQNYLLPAKQSWVHDVRRESERTYTPHNRQICCHPFALGG